MILLATKAHIEGNARHLAKLERIVIQPYKEEAQKIKDAATKAGVSVTRYIMDAVRARMENESRIGG